MTERRINRYQMPELQRTLKSGFVYAIRGRECIDGKFDLALIEGKANKDQSKARRNAWEAGKLWLAEIGIYKEVGRHFISRTED